jgi:hypothetical protein
LSTETDKICTYNHLDIHPWSLEPAGLPCSFRSSCYRTKDRWPTAGDGHWPKMQRFPTGSVPDEPVASRANLVGFKMPSQIWPVSLNVVITSPPTLCNYAVDGCPRVANDKGPGLSEARCSEQVDQPAGCGSAYKLSCCTASPPWLCTYPVIMRHRKLRRKDPILPGTRPDMCKAMASSMGPCLDGFESRPPPLVDSESVY